MSDLLIRGIEMPKDGHWGTVSIPFYIHGDGSVSDSKGHIIGSAVPVPPHGDLVDLSSPFVAQYYDEMKEEWMEKSVTVGDVLHDCMVYGMPPTIIPAEEE